MGLTLKQRLELLILGRTYLGSWAKPGWKGPLPWYAFKCPKHDLVANYVQGGDELRCPLCFEEELR